MECQNKNRSEQLLVSSLAQTLSKGPSPKASKRDVQWCVALSEVCMEAELEAGVASIFKLCCAVNGSLVSLESTARERE